MEPRAPAPTLLSRIGDAFLARPGISGRWPVGLQLVLILLWHPVTYFLIVNPVTADLAPAVVTGAARFWRELDLRVDHRTQSVLFEPLPSGPLPQTAGLLPIWMVVEGAMAWAVFFGLVRVPRGYGESGLRIFVRSWWRAWLWATGLFPLGACGLMVLEPLRVIAWVYVFGLLVLWGYVFGAPAFLASRELRRRRPRLARWRPVCPECGYSLRHLYGERCPECGAAFPTRSRVFRRWAIRRLVWDSVQRGSLLFAYVRSVFVIVVCPCAAARRLAMPDRYGRAVRWGVVHIVLAALVGTAMAAAPYIALWVREALYGPHVSGRFLTVAPELRELDAPTVGSVLWWSLHALVAWSLTLAVLPLLGIALGHLVRRRHPLARRGIAKWSLYVCVVPLVVLAVCCGYGLASRSWFNAAATLSLLYEFPPGRPPVAILAGLYALWWARGVSANRYLRERGMKVFCTSALLYVAVWLILTRIFFDPGALVHLL